MPFVNLIQEDRLAKMARDRKVRMLVIGVRPENVARVTPEKLLFGCP